MNRHNHLAANATDHSIKFNVAFKVMIGNESEEIVVGAADLHTGRDIIDLAALPGLKFDSPGKVENRSGIIPLLEMTVLCGVSLVFLLDVKPVLQLIIGI